MPRRSVAQSLLQLRLGHAGAALDVAPLGLGVEVVARAAAPARGIAGRFRARLAQLLPVALRHLDAEPAGRALDPLEGIPALFVRDVFHLVEPGDRVTDVRGVVERFLALARERVLAVGHLVTLCCEQLVGSHACWVTRTDQRQAPNSRRSRAKWGEITR